MPQTVTAKNNFMAISIGVNNKINDKYVQKVRMQISSMIGALDNLTAEGSKNDRLLSDIRYINTMILNTHRALIKSLQSESN